MPKTLHQYRVLMGTSKNAKNSTWCTNCENENTLFQLDGCYVCKKYGEIEFSVIIEHVTKSNRGQYKSINHIKNMLCYNLYILLHPVVLSWLLKNLFQNHYNRY